MSKRATVKPCNLSQPDACRADFLQELQRHADVEQGYMAGVKENILGGISQLVDELRQLRGEVNALCKAHSELAASIKIRFATHEAQIAALQSAKPGNGATV